MKLLIHVIDTYFEHMPTQDIPAREDHWPWIINYISHNYLFMLKMPTPIAHIAMG